MTAAAHSDQWWGARAACGDADPELFFVEPGRSSAPAKRICASCPVRQPCLELALAAAGSYAEDHGIYGGLTPRERLAVRRRRAAAPARHRPKVPAVAWTAARRDRAEATRAFALAERVGINEAARRLQISTASLYRAWRHWGLGRPDSSGSVARRQRQLESGEGRRRAFRHLERQRLRTSAAAGLPPGQPAASLPPADQVA